MMNSKKKYIVTIFILLSLTLYSGCITINIKGVIDSDFNAVYQGDIELNLSNSEYSQQALVQEGMIKLSTYWQDIGYESNVSFDSDIYHVYFKNQKQCTNFEEAFDELFKMMTDEYSPFSTLSYAFTAYENYSEYEVYGSVDLEGLLDMNVYDTLQDDIKSTVDEELSNLDAVVEFDLPNHENTGTLSSSNNAFSYKVLPGETTEFNFTGKINTSALLDGDEDIGNKSRYYSTLNYVLGGILAILVLIVIILLSKLRKTK